MSQPATHIKSRRVEVPSSWIWETSLHLGRKKNSVEQFASSRALVLRQQKIFFTIQIYGSMSFPSLCMNCTDTDYKKKAIWMSRTQRNHSLFVCHLLLFFIYLLGSSIPVFVDMLKKDRIQREPVASTQTSVLTWSGWSLCFHNAAISWNQRLTAERQPGAVQLNRDFRWNVGATGPDKSTKHGSEHARPQRGNNFNLWFPLTLLH